MADKKVERTAESILGDITEYRSYLDRRTNKYRRNFNRYTSNGARNEDIWNLYGNPLGYYYNVASVDTGPLPTINVIRSCIETHVSKIAQTKVRPFFNPRNGTFKTFKVCENAQAFFDQYYRQEDIYTQATEALRDAEIFEYGLLWIDEQNVRIERIRPWQFFYDPAEFHYSKGGKYLTRCFIEYRNYPVSMLMQTKSGEFLPEDVKKQYKEFQHLKVKWNIYYDLANLERVEFCNDKLMRRIPLESNVVPFEFIWYSPPVKSGFSTSLVDNLYTIQTEIDTLSRKIHMATELSPANTIFLPNGTLGKPGSIKASKISADIGRVYEYDASIPGNGQFVVSTPRPIDESYKVLLDYYVLKAYEMEGISQLSAQSKVSSNIQSGVMLDSLQDVESERHQVILSNYITMLMHVAEKMISIFPDDALILPKRQGVKNVTWKDVKTERDNYALEFAPSSVLSNDPSTKMKEVEKLISMKVINAPQANKLLEFPDIQSGFNVVNSSYDDCQAIIQRAIEDEEYDFYEVVNLQELYSETVNMLLRLDSNNESIDVLTRLTTLLTKVKHQMDELNQVANPQQPPPPQAPVEVQPVQDLAMNGAQVTSIVDLVTRVQAQQITPEAAKAVILSAFPNVAPELIDRMVGVAPVPPQPEAPAPDQMVPPQAPQQPIQ